MALNCKDITTTILILSACLFQSCANDKSEDIYMVTGSYSTLGTIVETDGLLIESDIYGLLAPANAEQFVNPETDTVGQRALLEFAFEEQTSETSADGIRPIQLSRFYKVLTKRADDIRNSGQGFSDNAAKQYGSNPIEISAASISKHHLNVQYYILGHNTEDIPHRISLVLTNESSLDEDGLIRAELRHDANGDLQKETFWGVVSFTLSDIPECSDPKFEGFRIVYHNAEGASQEYIAARHPT